MLLIVTLFLLSLSVINDVQAGYRNKLVAYETIVQAIQHNDEKRVARYLPAIKRLDPVQRAELRQINTQMLKMFGAEGSDGNIMNRCTHLAKGGLFLVPSAFVGFYGLQLAIGAGIFILAAPTILCLDPLLPIVCIAVALPFFAIGYLLSKVGIWGFSNSLYDLYKAFWADNTYDEYESAQAIYQMLLSIEDDLY